MAKGDISERARARAAELANDPDLRRRPPRESTAPPQTRATKLRISVTSRAPVPGTVLTRVYKGETLQVKVLREGFEYEGEVYKSLSAVAKKITGSHCNGYLDADNVPVRDPTYLFDTPQYAQSGAIFWPDYHRLSRDRAAWRVFGDIPYRDEPEVESGQIIIDKARCWRALTFANWCGERSAFFFQHVYGDKELFHLCWRKWSMYDNPHGSGFQFEAECLRFIDELKRGWSPAAQTLPTDADRAAIAAMDGRRFEYHRVGYDHRLMVFRGDGTFAAGGAGCERYWTIRDRRLMIAGDDGRLTMDLAQTVDGGWEGRWVVHEKMGIRLEPKP